MNGNNKSKEQLNSLAKAFREVEGVLKGATCAGEKFNKEVYKAKKVLQGKPKKEKPVVSVSEMKSSCLYVLHGSDGNTLYKRVNGQLEKMVNDGWIEVKVTREMLINTKFREY